MGKAVARGSRFTPLAELRNALSGHEHFLALDDCRGRRVPAATAKLLTLQG